MKRDRQWADVADAVRKTMRANKGKDTKPEIATRKLLWQAGYRYRLQAEGLPGKPDIVFSGRKKAVFVHGCFWHQHEGCGRAHVPQSRMEYWRSKLEGNQARDTRNKAALVEAGWTCHVVWECQLRRPAEVLKQLRAFLDD